MRLTLDVAQFGGKGVVCHEDGTECGDICWFCYKLDQFPKRARGGHNSRFRLAIPPSSSSSSHSLFSL